MTALSAIAEWEVTACRSSGRSDPPLSKHSSETARQTPQYRNGLHIRFHVFSEEKHCLCSTRWPLSCISSQLHRFMMAKWLLACEHNCSWLRFLQITLQEKKYSWKASIWGLFSAPSPHFWLFELFSQLLKTEIKQTDQPALNYPDGALMATSATAWLSPHSRYGLKHLDLWVFASRKVSQF